MITHRSRLAIAALTAAVMLLPSSAPERGLSRLPAVRAEVGAGDDPNAQLEMEFLMLRDPVANAIPSGIRQRERRFARTLPMRAARRGKGAATHALTWTERGPNNVGGRTRAFAVDVAAPATLLAGAVAGGIWKSTDDGASWDLKTAPGQLHGTTCIAQDTRPGHTGTWYVGTGEIRGSTTNDTRWGSLYRGDGLFKSTDGGATWTLLPSTISGTPEVTDHFDFVINVATNPANLAEAEVLAATSTGIHRSTDGGASWTRVIASDSSFTDVAVTPAGVRYAATRSGGVTYVWRSTNGVSWTNIRPTSFPTLINRVVIGLAPSNPNLAYFFLQGVSSGPSVAGHQLWRYDYLAGDGSSSGGAWVNRATMLPPDLNTQGGYDMTIHVRPDNENFVIIGGTDLYRSTNGFASTAATTTIGGYPFWPYGNHHPDLHAGAFSPVNPLVYYSAGDGGIARAHDITLADMEWESLNHGFNVTQFYSVSISPDAGSDMILAGAQDNGSQLGNAPGASDWTMVFGGDGTVVKVAPAADDRLYTQYQNGPLHRQNHDGTEIVLMTPQGSTNALFVNPIALDPNVTTRLYYAAGVNSVTSRIWRNDSAPVADVVTGWASLIATDVGAGSGWVRKISALGLSTAANPNVLYYGTTDGIVRRADDAHTNAPVITTISPPGLNAGTKSGGFVRCIAVDPTDSDRALLVFGNYNFPSLWYTTDGGLSWTDVEGNLSGPSGPSVRWASMFHVDGELQVFLGTSIGVLSTGALAGGATVWAQEAANEIGNVLIAWMDYRPSDRTLAVGTHGRGVFTTQFTPTVSAPAEPPATRVRLGAPRPNPASRHATIAFELPRATDVSLRVFDLQGRAVATLARGPHAAGRHEARLAASGLPPGSYTVVLRADGTTLAQRLTLAR